MKETVRKFMFRLLVLGLVLTCLGYGIFHFVIPQHYFPAFPLVPFFLYLITFVVHWYLVKVSEGDNRRFTSRYLGAMGLKIFIYLVFIIIFLALDTSQAIPFLVSFLVMYSAFTIFEVISILNTLKNNK